MDRQFIAPDDDRFTIENNLEMILPGLAEALNVEEDEVEILFTEENEVNGNTVFTVRALLIDEGDFNVIAVLISLQRTIRYNVSPSLSWSDIIGLIGGLFRKAGNE